jgi:hypothetical protein
MASSRFVGLVTFLVASILVVSPSWAGCKKSLTMRETPGGTLLPGQLVECDESETPELLLPSAHLDLCNPKVLSQTGTSFEDCARAVDSAREGLRQAKVREAVRSGTDDALIAQRYGASNAEIDAARATADLSGPVPTATQGVSQ